VKVSQDPIEALMDAVNAVSPQQERASTKTSSQEVAHAA
jgi:ribosomal protein S7